MRTLRLIFTTLALTILISGFQPAYAQAKGPDPVGLRPDAPTYAVHGPFWVGYKPLVIGAGTDRQLDAGIWYPALNPSGAKEEITYNFKFKFKMGPFSPGDPGQVFGAALLNAAPDLTKGAYPLLVWQPGFGVSGPWESAQLEHYASYGFVVVVPEPIEVWDAEATDFWKSAMDRPRDIKQTLDFAEKLTASGGEMAGLIDMKNVAVGGHSFGGYTALAMGGAQIDFDAFKTYCAALSKEAFALTDCPAALKHEAEMAARVQLNPIPKGLWPSVADSRVKAIIPMASDVDLFGKAGLAKITIPMLLLSGTFDYNYEMADKVAYTYASSAQKGLVGLIGADHPINMTLCKNLPWVSKIDMYMWLCFDPVWDKSRGLDLINHLTTAFLLDTLKGDKDAHKALLPDAVAFPGIDYKTTMK